MANQTDHTAFTVRELIAHLSTIDPDLPVFLEDEMYGVAPLCKARDYPPAEVTNTNDAVYHWPEDTPTPRDTIVCLIRGSF